MVVLWLETKQNLVELEASLDPAEAEVGAVAKADQSIFQVKWPKYTTMEYVLLYYALICINIKYK